jgi:hypothetical protein
LICIVTWHYDGRASAGAGEQEHIEEGSTRVCSSSCTHFVEVTTTAGPSIELSLFVHGVAA